MVVPLVIISGVVLGCGGEIRAGGDGGGSSGTTPGTYAVAVTGTSGSITEMGTISLTVQ